jgi:hypothetical protein
MLDGVPPRVIDPVDGARFATAVDFARHLVPEAPWREFPGEVRVCATARCGQAAGRWGWWCGLDKGLQSRLRFNVKVCTAS